MTEEIAKIRIFHSGDLIIGTELPLNEENSHYLTNVMRLQIGDNVSVFNGVDGEFLCRIKNSKS